MIFTTTTESELANRELDLVELGYRQSQSSSLKPGEYRKAVEVDHQRHELVFALEWKEPD